MKTINRLLAFLMAILLVAFSGCALIDDDETGEKDGEFVFDDNLLVGMFLYVYVWDSQTSQYTAVPTDNLDDENAISFFPRIKDAGGYPYIEILGSDYLTDLKSNVTNAGTNISLQNPNGKVEVSATFIFTYELLGSILQVEEVYKKNLKNEYFAVGSIGETLNDFALTTWKAEHTVSAKATDSKGQTVELSYFGKFTLDIKFSDYLTMLKVTEFDEQNVEITCQTVDLNSDDFVNYQAQSNCAYVLIEEQFEVKHDSSNKPKGTVYKLRYLINKSDIPQTHYFNAPAGNGFTKTNGVKVEF